MESLPFYLCILAYLGIPAALFAVAWRELQRGDTDVSTLHAQRWYYSGVAVGVVLIPVCFLIFGAFQSDIARALWTLVPNVLGGFLIVVPGFYVVACLPFGLGSLVLGHVLENKLSGVRVLGCSHQSAAAVPFRLKSKLIMTPAMTLSSIASLLVWLWICWGYRH